MDSAHWDADCGDIGFVSVRFMHDHQAFRQTAIRYWERRRILYNLALVLPGLGFALTDTINWVGDEHQMHYFYILA